MEIFLISLIEIQLANSLGLWKISCSVPIGSNFILPSLASLDNVPSNIRAFLLIGQGMH